MKFRLLSVACVPLLLAACEKKMEVTITEVRPLTTRDTPPKLNATDDERFLDARPAQTPGGGEVKAEAPAAWQTLPGTPFRVLNYRFGTSGEVWVSLSAGSLADNVNRWLRQFGATPLDDAGVSALRKVEIAGAQGAWVETEGHYEPGMGQPGKDGQALAGVIALVNGRIVTVKMVGPKTEVVEQKSALEAFARSLKLAE